MDPRYSAVPYSDPGRPAVLANAAITEASASASSRHGAASTARRTKPAATWAHISAAVLESLRDLHYVLSLSGNIQHVSPNSPALLGYGHEELVGTVLVDHVHEDDAPVYRDELREASSTGRPFRFYCRIRSRINIVGADTNADTALFPSEFAERDPTSSPSFSVFEITGRFHEVAPPGPIPVGIGITATPPSDDGLFVLMARPYPLAQGTKLDSFLSLKIENERLNAQLAALRAEQENESDADSEEFDGYQTRQYSMAAPTAAFTTMAMRRPSDGFPWFDIPPANVTLTTGSASSAQESVFSGGGGSGSSMFGPASSSSTNTSASIVGPSLSSPSPRSAVGNKPQPALLSRTFSTTAVPGTIAATTSRARNNNNNNININININNYDNRSPPTNTPTVMEGDVGIPFIVKALTGGAGFKKRAKQSVDDYVCTWCSTTASPEWRKGPDGPKTLCNACGLRYAKFRRKSGGSGSGGGGGDGGNGPATGPAPNGGGGGAASSAGSKAPTVGPVVA